MGTTNAVRFRTIQIGLHFDKNYFCSSVLVSVLELI
jgi:hypothetical protein